MKNREIQDYLNDIRDTLADIQSFTSGMSFPSFKQDKKTIYATIRCIEIIGEAARKIPQSVKVKYPMVPWMSMSDMRNKMIHEYFGIDIEILWQTVQEDIPALKSLVDQIK